MDRGREADDYTDTMTTTNTVTETQRRPKGLGHKQETDTDTNTDIDTHRYTKQHGNVSTLLKCTKYQYMQFPLYLVEPPISFSHHHYMQHGHVKCSKYVHP